MVRVPCAPPAAASEPGARARPRTPGRGGPSTTPRRPGGSGRTSRSWSGRRTAASVIRPRSPAGAAPAPTGRAGVPSFRPPVRGRPVARRRVRRGATSPSGRPRPRGPGRGPAPDAGRHGLGEPGRHRRPRARRPAGSGPSRRRRPLPAAYKAAAPRGAPRPPGPGGGRDGTRPRSERGGNPPSHRGALRPESHVFGLWRGPTGQKRAREGPALASKAPARGWQLGKGRAVPARYRPRSRKDPKCGSG